MRRRRYLRLALMLITGLSILLSLSWLPFFSQAPDALAHAFVVGSDPVDGSTITTAPSKVRIFFDADISPASGARVYVFAPGGPSNGSEVDEGRSYIPANNPRELDTPLASPSNLPQGSYEVKWTAIAMDDGHATSGLIGFILGQSVTGLSGTPILGPSTSNYLPQLNLQGILAVLWEWLTMLALTFWVGMVMMEGLLVLGARSSSGDDQEGGVLASLRKQGRPLQWLCLATALVGEIINLVLRGALLTEANLRGGIDLATLRQLVLETSYGHLWLARLGLVCLALGFLWWTTRERTQQQAARFSSSVHTRKAASRFSQMRIFVADELQSEHDQGIVQDETTRQASAPAKITTGSIASPPATPILSTSLPVRSTLNASAPRWHTIAWLVLAGLILLTLGFSSDTAQLAQAHYSAVILDWLHLLAQAAWFGGAAYLGFVLLPLLPTLEPDHSGKFLVNLLRYYMPLLLASLGLLLLSNLFLSETTISNAQQWLNDAYGRALLVMLLLFALMLVFTIYSFFYLRPALRRQTILLPVVHADLPARRARRSALEQTESGLKHAMHVLSVLGAGVLLCAALMSFFAPPIVFPDINYTNPSSNTGSPGNAQNVLTQHAGDLTVSLEVLPGRVGAVNTVIVTLKDSNGTPVTDAQVKITINMQVMDMGTTNKDLPPAGGNSTYVAVFRQGESFSMIGAWAISLTILRPNHAAAQTQFVIILTS